MSTQRPFHGPAPAATRGWKPHATPTLHLLPGELFFGQGGQVKTLLGSCVALTLWHPERHLGGMCHYMLPTRKRAPGEALDARYGDEAVLTLVQALKRSGTLAQDYVVNMYGGADTMPDGERMRFNVGERNIEIAWSLIEHYGFSLQHVDVGDNMPRHVGLNLQSGAVVVRRGTVVGVRGLP